MISLPSSHSGPVGLDHPGAGDLHGRLHPLRGRLPPQRARLQREQPARLGGPHRRHRPPRLATMFKLQFKFAALSLCLKTNFLKKLNKFSDITNSFDGMCVRFGSNQESAKNTASAIYWCDGFTAMLPNLILTLS